MIMDNPEVQPDPKAEPSGEWLGDEAGSLMNDI
jgi:hypothetical protein